MHFKKPKLKRTLSHAEEVRRDLASGKVPTREKKRKEEKKKKTRCPDMTNFKK